MLAARGIAVTAPWMMKLSAPITQEVLRLIADADFVAAVIDGTELGTVMYELGVASGLGKPAFIVVIGGQQPFDITGMVVRNVESGRISEASDDLERFLRNAKAGTQIDVRPRTSEALDLTWARAELARVRAGASDLRGQTFERFVKRLFESAAAELTAIDPPDLRNEIDFVVWLNDVSFEAGGPILVECKVLRGGSGSVIKNAEAYVKRLARTVDGTNASLAMLVFDHDRPNAPPSLYETPKVLSFAVDELISALENGTLGKEIIHRRRRAAFVRGSET